MQRRFRRGWVILALAAGAMLCATIAFAQEQGGRRETLTLKPERKIEFTTDEGTWISVDVSPDGQTIVFDMLGDIFTMPFTGGEAKAIATGMAFDSQPKFSPDGKWIAFISDRSGGENLWIMKADGSDPRALTRDPDSEFASPVWTPDGQYLIAARTTWPTRVHELWMYHIHGGSGTQLTRATPPGAAPAPPTPGPGGQPPRVNSIGAAISPDGRYLYYSRKMNGFQYNAMFPLWQITRHDRVTGEDDVLTNAEGSAMRPVISPDGTKMVYATRYETQTGLRIRNLKTGEERWVKYPVTRDDQESRYTMDLMPGYTFTPDAKSLLISYGGKIHRLDVATGADPVIPFTAKVSQDLGPKLDFPYRVDQGPVRARLIQSPVQSPDGSKLVFSALTHLHVMDLPATCASPCQGSSKRLTTGNAREYQPIWSPDGQWIAYVTWDNGRGGIWKIHADGSGSPQQLTTAPLFYSDPVWSPDGKRIVALRTPAQTREDNASVDTDLVWIPAEGGEATTILPARGLANPHFTHDSERIYLRSNQGLISVRWDGTERRTHLRVTGTGTYSADQPVPAEGIVASPDGRWVLAHVMNQLYLTAMPLVGGETPTINVNTPSVPVKKLTDIGADYFDWADDGKTVTWAIGASFLREKTDSISFDTPTRPGGGEGGEGGEAADAGESAPPPGTAALGQRPAPMRAAANAQEYTAVVEVPRKTPKGIVVLRGATVITMKGEEVIQDADIVVTDNHITSVGKRGTSVPAGARIFDVKGKTIVPGFCDTHAHWFEIKHGVLDMQNWSFMANVAYGVTTGLDVQPGTNDMFAYQDLTDAGEIIGLRAFSTGPGVFSNNHFQSLEQVKDVLERYKNYYRTTNIKSYIVGSRRVRQWMVEASKALGMMPTTEGGLDQKLDLTHFIDGMHGNEHTLPYTPLYKDTVQLVAQSGTAYTPTFIVQYGGPFAENFYYMYTEVHDNAKLAHFTPHTILDQKTQRRGFWFRKEEFAFPQHAAQATKILRAGGYVGIGSHGQLQGLGYHWEMWNLASGGATPMEVLRSATIHSAKIIGVAQDVGSIEPGKLADLVILDKSPLDDIHNTNTIRWVMKNGELFEGDTLNQIWPEQKPLAPFWWYNEKPSGGALAMPSAEAPRPPKP
jgi:Tol biopolymer transport system component